jgi:hypothetical protein
MGKKNVEVEEPVVIDKKAVKVRRARRGAASRAPRDLACSFDTPGRVAPRRAAAARLRTRARTRLSTVSGRAARAFPGRKWRAAARRRAPTPTVFGADAANVVRVAARRRTRRRLRRRT